jgi:hypothetical protein
MSVEMSRGSPSDGAGQGTGHQKPLAALAPAGEYLAAVLRRWYFLVVGLVGGVLSLIDLMTSKTYETTTGSNHQPVVHTDTFMPVWIWVLIMIVGLVLAQYLAWVDMRGKREAVIAERDVVTAERDALKAGGDLPLGLQVERTYIRIPKSTALVLRVTNESQLQIDAIRAKITKMERFDPNSSSWNEIYVDRWEYFKWDGPGIETSILAGSHADLLVASTDNEIQLGIEDELDDDHEEEITEPALEEEPGTLFRADANDIAALSAMRLALATWRFRVAFEADHRQTETQIICFKFEQDAEGGLKLCWLE